MAGAGGAADREEGVGAVRERLTDADEDAGGSGRHLPTGRVDVEENGRHTPAPGNGAMAAATYPVASACASGSGRAADGFPPVTAELLPEVVSKRCSAT